MCMSFFVFELGTWGEIARLNREFLVGKILKCDFLFELQNDQKLLSYDGEAFSTLSVLSV